MSKPTNISYNPVMGSGLQLGTAVLLITAAVELNCFLFFFFFLIGTNTLEFAHDNSFSFVLACLYTELQLTLGCFPYNLNDY